jgi:hypothetical protein
MGSHLSDANAKRDRETSPIMRKAGGRRDRPQSTTFRSSKRSRHRADAVIETQSRRCRRGDEWLAYCRGSASIDDSLDEASKTGALSGSTAARGTGA